MTEPTHLEITMRDLRNRSAEIMRAVERGESFTICRKGSPIGRLIPLQPRTFTARHEVMAAFSRAPIVDAARFRDDLDAMCRQDSVSYEW